ncbi:hypothetical protein [Methanoregula sp.]|uniref:mechanosensitive ion channel family protein n=1 Tax=Methanoregula sp. TaxID=2052170 RepID=UPI00236E341C|nr:hypothetical protein [Methanoregula sp.]MDD1686767.1 hypothetical protein [Methanoregula sp.]
MAVLPAIIGALIVLLVGWIVGRLLGKAVRIIIDKVTATAISTPVIGESDVGKSVIKSNVSLGHVGDILVRVIVYLIAILAAVDILNMDYLSAFMTRVIEYIPHVVAFLIILVVGIILIDYFIDLFKNYSKTADIELLRPVLLLLRVFLYFVVIMLALSQLLLDLTIIYTIITPIFWGIGIGLGASIAIVVWFGMKNRSEQIMDKVMEVISK